MSSITVLNSQLHRTLQSGIKYNKHFSKAACKEVYLGKGVTTFGLHKMKELTNQYHAQTKSIAQVLKATTLDKTALNIKQFLYNHLQYNADGFEQNLRSPNCSWVSRKEGIDCKSYSLFAGCILKSLKIPFKYRKITQPSSPENWSHVYVVVPSRSGKELIIDATISSNSEVEKVKKEDLYMEAKLPYYGLNGVDNHEQAKTTVSNFKKFLNYLNNRGVSKSTTKQIEIEVRKSTDIGIDPKIKIHENYIVINNNRIDYYVGMGKVDWGGILDSGISAATGDIAGGVLGLFSNLFGGGANQKWVSNVVEPLQSWMESGLATANKNNIHNFLTDIDKRLNVVLAHEKAINSHTSRVIVPKIEAMITVVRGKYSSLQRVKKRGTGTYTNTWDGKQQLTQTVSYYEYSKVSPMPSIVNTPYNNSSNLDVNGLIKLASGLFKDPQTSQVYTPQQVVERTNQIAQNAQGNTSVSATKEDTGMSMGTKVAIAGGVVAVIGVGVVVAMKKNII